MVSVLDQAYHPLWLVNNIDDKIKFTTCNNDSVFIRNKDTEDPINSIYMVK